MGRFDGYEPIPAEDLPARYAGIFDLLELTFSPPNDFDRVMTLTGKTLQLVTDGGNDRRRARSLVMHAGYQRAIWELREGHLRWCPSQKRLWRRDADVEDHGGPRNILNSWHPVSSIEDEYHVGTKSTSSERNPAISGTIMREAARPQWFDQVERGVRIDPCVWVRRDGHALCLRDDPDIAVTQTFDPRGMGNQAIEQARRICRWLTADDASCSNLLRMFATPWLEPFKQLTYVLSGHGGDGKSLLMINAVQDVLGDAKSFPAFSTRDYCQSYSLASESMNAAMVGKAFAYDDECGGVSEDMLPALRALSTGSTVRARVVGGRYFTMTPTATMVLLTNQPFADSSEPSDERRFVKVEMHSSKGRTYGQYHAIETWIRNHPAALYAASCRLWEQGDSPEHVTLSPARAIDDETYWLVVELLANERKFGRLFASRDAFRDEFHHSVPESTMALLGLSNATSSVGAMGRRRIVKVKDPDRFARYRQLVEDEDDDNAVPAPPEPLDLDEQPDPVSLGFGADYAPADRSKIARNWKRITATPSESTHLVPDAPAYAVVPRDGWLVIDMDTSGDKGDDGWTILNREIGAYGTPAFPPTLLVRTPSCGMHAYYRLPDRLRGHVKNAAHPRSDAHPDGIPVDLRVERKGYVVGPGSQTEAGSYRVCDLPGDDGIPFLSDRQVAWLDANGYTDTSPVARPGSGDRHPAVKVSVDDVTGDPDRPNRPGRPDMRPVPKGERNTTLHAWAYGRAMNHPDNLSNIESDLYRRGRDSGLDDGEIGTMWGSIMRQLGKETRCVSKTA